MRNFVTVCFFGIVLAALLAAPPMAAPQHKPKLPRPQPLGRGVELHRDPASGELREGRAQSLAPGLGPPAATIRTRVTLVEVNCNVLAPDGAAIAGLSRDDFRLFEDGVEQAIAHFDASREPASIVLLLDASPSVFRELDEIKAAARTLAATLAPRDEVAVAAFAREAELLLPFSRDRALLERALRSPELARVTNSSESNIYRALYLTALRLFRERTGRKAVILLTDGQDSGLGLSWDPASAVPRAGQSADRMTFEDVARELAATGVELYAISTQPRPHAMTDGWLQAHRRETLVTPAARALGIPHYTLYLAELVRRAGGRLYFLRELESLSEVYRHIGATIGAQYTLGYYPGVKLPRAGWRELRVELRGSSRAPLDARLTYRAAYYLFAGP